MENFRGMWKIKDFEQLLMNYVLILIHNIFREEGGLKNNF